MAEAVQAIGIDAGGTATRWNLVDEDGASVVSGAAPPFHGHVFSDAARDQARTAIRAVAAGLPEGVRPRAVVAGITGLPGGAAEDTFFIDMLAEAFAIPAASVQVGNDLWIGYRARFAPGEGIVVYAGTGSAAIHIATSGEIVRAGGYGFMVDDAGSAFWIAIEAIRHVLRGEEATPRAVWRTQVGRELASGIGSADWSEVRDFLYGGDRGRTGLLAKRVAAAARAGDPTALSIFAAAGCELARLANVLRGRLGPLPVALAGGASWLHPRLAAAFGEGLEGGAFTHDDLDASLSAARMALQLAR